MAAETEIVRIALEITGRDKVAELTAAIEAERASLAGLDASLKAGGISATHHGQQTADAADRVRGMRAALEAEAAALGASRSATAAATAAATANTSSAAANAAAVQQQGAAARQATADFDRYRDALKSYGVEASARRTTSAVGGAAIDLGGRSRAPLDDALGNSVDTRSIALMTRLGDEATRAGAKIASGVGRRGNGGLALLEFSRLTEDAQYGVAGILNNIPTLVMALGGAGGLAGAISLVAVGGNLLYKNWDNFAGLVSTRLKVPPVDASSLDGLAEKIKGVGEQLDGFRKRGSIGVGEMESFRRLEAEEKDLKARHEAHTDVDALGKLKTGDETKTGAMLDKAFGEADADKRLAELKGVFIRSAQLRNPRGKADPDSPVTEGEEQAAARIKADAVAQFDKIIHAIRGGNEAAYDQLIGLVKASMGDDSRLAAELENAREKARPSGDALGDHRARAADAKRAEDRRRADFDQTAQGAENEAAMKAELIGGAVEKFTAAQADAAEAIVIRGRAAADKASATMDTLKARATRDILRIAPALASFPDALGDAVKAVARAATDAVDATLARLKAEEGLTEAQALRRLDQARKSKDAQSRGRLADDEIGQFVETQYNQRRRLNPQMPELTPEARQQLAAQQRQRLDAMGLSDADQARLGKTLNDPKRRRKADGVMARLAEAGVGEADALRLLPEVFDRAGEGGAVALNRASRLAASGLGRRRKGRAAEADDAARDLANAPGGGLRSVGIAPGSKEAQLNRLMAEAAAGSRPPTAGPGVGISREQIAEMSRQMERQSRDMLRPASGPSGGRAESGNIGADFADLCRQMPGMQRELAALGAALSEANRKGVPVVLR